MVTPIVAHETATAQAPPLAAIYARVSTDDQADYGYSLPAQIAACRDLAAREGLQVDERLIFVEDYTGTTLSRPELTKLRAVYQSGTLGAVIVRDLDRLSRKLAHQLLLREDLLRSQVQLKVVNLPALSASPESQLLANFMGSFAEYDRLKILQRTKDGLLGRAKAGKVSGSRAPLGYRYADGTFVIDAEEAALVVHIFTRYALDGLSLYALAQELTAQQIPTAADRRQGGPKRRLSPGTWHPASLHDILSNETYIGICYWNKTENLDSEDPQGRKTRSRLRPRAEWIGVPVPRIIEDTLFALAQQRRLQAQHTNPRNTKYAYLLGGSRLRCRVCRCAMGGSRNSRSGKRFYRCNRMPYQKEALCKRRLDAARVEAQVWQALQQAIAQPEVFTRQLADVRQDARQEQASLERDRATYLHTIAGLEERGKKAYSAYEADALTLEEFKARKAELDEERVRLQAEVDGLGAQLASLTIEDLDLTGLEAFLSRVGAILDQMGFEERRKVLDILRITAWVERDGGITCEGYLPEMPLQGDGAFPSTVLCYSECKRHGFVLRP